MSSGRTKAGTLPSCDRSISVCAAVLSAFFNSSGVVKSISPPAVIRLSDDLTGARTQFVAVRSRADPFDVLRRGTRRQNRQQSQYRQFFHFFFSSVCVKAASNAIVPSTSFSFEAMTCRMFAIKMFCWTRAA